MSTGEKRPIAHVLPIAEELVRVLGGACRRIEICGSLRRRCREVSDIELVAIPKTQDAADLFGEGKKAGRNLLWEELDKILRGHYVRAGEKYRAFRWPLTQTDSIQVDLFTAEPGNWGLIQLIRTGSAEFSRHVVTQLRRQKRPSHDGWVRQALDSPPWSEDDLFAMRKLETPTEESVFDYAAIPFREPNQRH